LFEIDAVVAPGLGAPLCDACSTAGAAPPPLPERRRSRPKVPVVTFARRGPNEAPASTAPVAEMPRESQPEPISLDDLEIISSPSSTVSGSAPPPSARVLDGGFVRSGRPSSVLPPAPGPDLSLSDLASDVEVVSLRDLDIVLGPASVPPAWEAAPVPGLSEVASNLKPRASRAAPVRPPPLPRSATLPKPPPLPKTEAVKEPPAPPAPKAKPATPRKPSFFDVEPSVPPPREEIPVATEEIQSVPPVSDRVDLMSLVAPPSMRPPRPPDLLNLQGGLFAHAPPPALPAPTSLVDAPPAAPIAPVLPVDRPPPSSWRPLPPRDEHVKVPVDAVEAAPRVLRSVAPEPLVSEHRSPPRRNGLLGWGAGAVAAAAVIAFVAARLGGEEAPREAAVVTAPAAPAAPPSASNEVRPAFEPRRERVATAEAPKPQPAPVRANEAAEKPLPASPATVRAAEPPRPAEPARVAEIAPPKERPAVEPRPAPPRPKEAPAPSGGGDFDRAAAKAALAAAASAASGCKEPDDPSGGARVAVTFAPSGRVTSSKVMGPPFQGTQTGGCIARAFRGITVPAFDGDPVTITKEVSVR
jgi:hypothetical protein